MESVRDFEMSVGCGPQKLNLKKKGRRSRKGENREGRKGNKSLKIYRNKIFGMKRSYFFFCRPNTRIQPTPLAPQYSAMSTLTEPTRIWARKGEGIPENDVADILVSDKMKSPSWKIS